jgi:hypothetical protein
MHEKIHELYVKTIQTKHPDKTWAYDFDEHYVEIFAELLKQAIYDQVKDELIPDELIEQEKPELREYLKGCNGGTVDALVHIRNFGKDVEKLIL